MDSDIEKVVNTLEIKREALAAEMQEVEDALETLRKLSGSIVVVRDGTPKPTGEYAGMGILEAARAFVKSVGRPVTTRELTDGLLAKGWTTKSRNVTATVYATLKNSKSDWRRNETGEWEYFGNR